MRAVPSMYRTKFAEGTACERAMNDLDKEGYEVVEVIFCGQKTHQNKLDPHQIAIIPLFLITGVRRAGRLLSVEGEEEQTDA